MENKNYIEFLNNVEKTFAFRVNNKLHLDEKGYREFIKSKSESLDINNYKIIKDHTLEEYFNTYQKYLGNNVLVFQKDELWLMDPKKTYWEIKNDSKDLYFEVPTKTLMFMYPYGCIATAFLLVAGLVTGILCGTLLKGNGGDNPTIEYEGLKFTSAENGSKVGYDIKNGTLDIDIQYSNDGDNWIDWSGADIELASNQYIYVRNNKSTLSSSPAYFNFSMSGKIIATGNVNSMINFGEISGHCYTSMFYGCTALVSAKDLHFPSTQLAEFCYCGMFNNCTSLTSAPFFSCYYILRFLL